MRVNKPFLSLICDCCGSAARLKVINHYPFTKGMTEATYECSACGSIMLRSLEATEATTRTPILADGKMP
jgi:uncharacterized Zn finger protein